MSSPESKRVKMETGTVKDSKDGLKSNSRCLRSNAVEIKAKKRMNFVHACEKVSCEAYFDRKSRLQLAYVPACARDGCKHEKEKANVSQMPPYAEESFRIEIKANMWFDALEVCKMCITQNQYLSVSVLKDVVEIMLNSHEDIYATYTITNLLDKCEEVLLLNFLTHPPCHMGPLRQCYIDFILTPMALKENTFTNRKEFNCNQGIVKYCMNRLKDEVDMNSRDDPIINRDEKIPEELKDGIQGLHWQQEKLEIFESLDRPERIKRLIVVLESFIKIFQYDLIIWQTRYMNNLGNNIMGHKKPLIAYYLWSRDILGTGQITENCRQIIWLFVHFIHLKYPEKLIQVMTTWLNTMIQSFYICETKSNSDYPNIGKYCVPLAEKFYNTIKGLPCKSISNILDKIEPTFMQYLVGNLHVKELLSKKFKDKEDDIIMIFIKFLEMKKWEKFDSESTTQLTKIHLKPSRPKTVHNVLHFLSKKCVLKKGNVTTDKNQNLYPKLQPLDYNIAADQNHVVHSIYTTFASYLDAYSVYEVQETLDDLNRRCEDNTIENNTEIKMPKTGAYSVSEDFVKKYRTIYNLLRELFLIWGRMKNDGTEIPKQIKIFDNLLVLGE